MILHALANYYERLKEDPDVSIPSPGYGTGKISFCLEIDETGELLQVHDLRVQRGKKYVAREMPVPQAVKRSGSGVNSNFMWDNATYLLGADDKGKPERTRKAHEAFIELHKESGADCDDVGMQALLAFLRKWNPAKAPDLPYWEDMTTANLVFRLAGERRYLHERPAIRQIWQNLQGQNDGDPEGVCLITGKHGPIKRLHNTIKGVRGGQAKGGDIVSFNLSAFCSYGKSQGYNAPVGYEAEFAYTTALNYLLRADSKQKIQIADATTVFWTEEPSPVEGIFAALFDGKADGDEAENAEVRCYLDALRNGKNPPKIDPEIQFYILGLSPNSARISVRFWHVSTVGDIDRRVGQHFSDLAIAKAYESDPEYPSLWRLLRETAPQQKTENILPLLSGEVMRSIITGSVYPRTLLTAIIGRIRADQEINYVRAAIIKACLVRHWRITGQNKEITMTLDPNNDNIAYVLGRLFAVLEKAQKDALPGINSTIKNRFFGSASATPRGVFPRLIRGAQHHIDKSEYGYIVDRQIQEIMQKINEFPSHLKLEDQGLFAIGYYHQRQALFTKRENAQEGEE